MDHIVTDFWSMTLLAREIIASYEANKKDDAISFPPSKRVIQIMFAGKRRCWQVRKVKNIGSTGATH